ncbi:MAG: four helix bundle protein [Minisyncoccia bacterium]
MQKPNIKNTDKKLKTDFKIRVYSYTVKSLKFLSTIPDSKINKIIFNQIVRSLTSIGANIIEAKACNSKKDFARYFDIALKSSNETKYWLCLLRDTDGSIDKTKIEEILKETIEISNILASSLLTMRNG